MNINLLVKFSNKEFLEPLQKDGLFYCNSIEYFAKLEDGQLRGDGFESVMELDYWGDALVQLKPIDKPDSEWVDLKSKDLQLKNNNLNPLGNLFCMSAFKIEVDAEPRTYMFNEQFNRFGSHYLLINNESIFLERLRSALKQLPFKNLLGRVKYLDLKKYSGKKNLFQKHNEFEWQEELRLYLDSEINKPFQFSIGSLEDISTIYELKSNPGLKIKLNHSTT